MAAFLLSWRGALSKNLSYTPEEVVVFYATPSAFPLPLPFTFYRYSELRSQCGRRTFDLTPLYHGEAGLSSMAGTTRH